MKRRVACAALGCWLAAGAAALAQSHDGHEAPAGGAGAHGAGFDGWKWANFFLLAAGLGFLLRKHAGPYFTARAGNIRKQMREAQEARQEAERHAASVEAKLAGLAVEIEALKRGALAEQEAERERFLRQHAADMVKIRAHAEQEIAAAGKQARLELKRHAAGLALALAEQRIRAGLTSEGQAALVDAFARDLQQSARRPPRTENPA